VFGKQVQDEAYGSCTTKRIIAPAPGRRRVKVKGRRRRSFFLLLLLFEERPKKGPSS